MLQVKRYTASWCGPCKAIAPYFFEFTQKYHSVMFQTIYIDVDKQESMDKGIRSVPTVILEKDGEEIKRFIGVNPKHIYAAAIENNL
jgi:thioredoxin 1